MLDATLYLALWGAALSSILGFIRIWEYASKKRVVIDTTYLFRGLYDLADEIVIANLSDRPLLILYWNLSWERKWRWSKKESIEIVEWEDEVSALVIAGTAIETLEFHREQKIPFGSRVKGMKLVLRMRVAGKRREVRHRVA